jgi:Tol biopolymer transport system component
LSSALWEGQPPVRTHRLMSLRGVPGRVVAPPDARSLDWSSDGRLAYIQDGNLFVVRPGKPARRLTWRGAGDPSWSPHGKRIAFTRRGQLYAMPSKGGRASRLTGRGGERPAWSPDGLKIAFLRAPPKTDTLFLYVLDLKRARVRRLSDEELERRPSGAYFSGIVSSPEWQPLP